MTTAFTIGKAGDGARDATGFLSMGAGGWIDSASGVAYVVLAVLAVVALGFGVTWGMLGRALLRGSGRARVVATILTACGVLVLWHGAMWPWWLAALAGVVCAWLPSSSRHLGREMAVVDAGRRAAFNAGRSVQMRAPVVGAQVVDASAAASRHARAVTSNLVGRARDALDERGSPQESGPTSQHVSPPES